MATSLHRNTVLTETILLAFLSLLIQIKGLSTTTPYVTGIERWRVTLICNRDGQIQPDVRWYFVSTTGHRRTSLIGTVSGSREFIRVGYSRWENDISSSGTSHLVILRLRVNRDDRDLGYFRCEIGSSHINIEVTVLVPAKLVSLVPLGSATLSTTRIRRFTCTAASKPRPTVTWHLMKRNNSTVLLHGATESHTRNAVNAYMIEVISSLPYRPQKEHNGDSIRCTANGPANTSSVYRNTRLIIHYHPDTVNPISGYTNPVTESRAESLHLACSVTGAANPNALTYAWSSGCGAGVRSTSAISVPRNKSMNNKQCYCTVRHRETGWQRDSPRLRFNIYFGPESVVITDKMSATGISGVRMLLTCTGSESNPVTSLNWYNTTSGSKTPLNPDVYGPTLDGRYGQIAQSIYRIVPNRHNDGQPITCEGQNPRVPDNKQSDYVILNILYPPILEPVQSRVENNIVVDNTTLILTCTAWAKPLADITWNPRPSTSTVNNNDDNYRRTSTFIIPAINRADTGMYGCSASNVHGRIQNSGFNVTVHSIPEVRVIVSRIPLTEGDNTQLECHASAVPDNYAYVDWTQHVNGVMVREFTRSNVLNLNNLTFEDTGEYRCSVENIIGRGTGSVRLNIKYAAKLVEVGNFSAGINDTATLSIMFIGDPQPMVTWYKDGSNSSLDNSLPGFSTKTVPTVLSWRFYDERVTIPGYEATLTIHSVQVHDYAAYNVILDNGVKTDLQIPLFFTHLVQNDKPNPPSDIKAICDVTTAKVSWVSQSNGGLKQTFNIQYDNNVQILSIVEEDPGEGREGTIQFIDLYPGRSYTFTIYAMNRLGSSALSERSCQTEQRVAAPAQPLATDSSINVAAIAAGVAVPLLVIIFVILVVVICVQRRRKANKHARKDIVLSDLTSTPKTHTDPSKETDGGEIHNTYAVIGYRDDANEDTNNFGLPASGEDAKLQNTTLNKDSEYLYPVPATAQLTSFEQYPSAGKNRMTHEYEATSSGDGAAKYSDARNEDTDGMYAELKPTALPDPPRHNDSLNEEIGHHD